jgi:sugar phosphate isomerase/epimerase
MKMTHRRTFLKRASALVAASYCTISRTDSLAASLAERVNQREHPIAVFAKPLQSLSTEELAKRLQSIGVQGLEATLRKGGQIEPEQFGEKLPQFCQTLAKYDQQVLIASSDINAVSTSTEAQVRKFAAEKIPFFRMAYYQYDFDKPLLPQLDTFADQARQLADLCRDVGIKALYQNHAGARYLGAAIWDLRQVLHDIAPDKIAVAIDLCHTNHELSESWPAAYRAIKPQIGAVFVKDFEWVDGKGVTVPLGSGRARPLWEQLVKDGFNGPLSLHMEHIDHRPEELLERRWQATVADVKILKEWMT